jgi:tRNA(Ile)-lysidine synthase
MNPSFRETMQKNIAQLSAAFSIIHHEIEQNISKLMQFDNEKVTIPLATLMQEKNPHFTLFGLLHPFQFNPATIESIYESLTGISGKQFFSPTHRLIKDRNQLLLFPINKETDTSFFINQSTSVLPISNLLTLEISRPLSSTNITIEKQKEIIFVDTNKLCFPLEVRHPRTGDFFYPFGNKGKKKLSDFFIDQKWNLHQKEKCWLLLSGDSIVWIIGVRLDNRFKVDEQTKTITKIRIL